MHIQRWFSMVKGYTYLQKQDKKEYILEDYFVVTWKQYREIISHIQIKQAKEEKIIGIDSSPFFIRPVKNFLEYELKLPIEGLNIREKNSKTYFFFDKISSKDKPLEENLSPRLAEIFDIKEVRIFGNVIFFELSPKEIYDSKEKNISIEEFFLQKKVYDDKYTWGSLLTMKEKKTKQKTEN